MKTRLYSALMLTASFLVAGVGAVLARTFISFVDSPDGVTIEMLQLE